MSERWKYQIKVGLFICAFVTLFGTLFEFRSKSFSDQIDSGDFYIRLVNSLLFGIFALGYMAWKSRNKKADKQ